MKMEIKIPEINKSVNLEVEPNHSLESIMKAVNRKLNLGREENWSLSWRGKRIPPPDYNKSIGQLGVKGEDWLELYTIEEKNAVTHEEDLFFSNIPAEIVKGPIEKNFPHIGLLTIDKSGVRFGGHESKVNYLYDNVSMEKINTFNYRLNSQWPDKAGYFSFYYTSKPGKETTLRFKIDFKTGERIERKYNELKSLCKKSGIEFTLQNLVQPYQIKPIEKPDIESNKVTLQNLVQLHQTKPIEHAHATLEKYLKRELVGKIVYNLKGLKVGDVVDVGYSKERSTALIVKSSKGKKIIPFESVNEIGDIILLKNETLI